MSDPSRILVVDDTPMNVKLLHDLLEVRGYAVETAGSGEEGLARVADWHPDLVLLDIMMPGMSGYEVCIKLRADPATAALPVRIPTNGSMSSVLTESSLLMSLAPRSVPTLPIMPGTSSYLMKTMCSEGSMSMAWR